MCGFRAPLPGLNAGARPHLQHRSHCHRATAYRRNRGSTFAAINHPSASRNLCQNQIIRTVTALTDPGSCDWMFRELQRHLSHPGRCARCSSVEGRSWFPETVEDS